MRFIGVNRPVSSVMKKSSAAPFELAELPGHYIRRLQQIAVGLFMEETQALNVTPIQYAALHTAWRWFPLVARTRPARGPARQRIADLENLADRAAATGDLSGACSVLNLSALFAVDMGLPDLAAQWCTRHAETLLSVRPCPEPRTSTLP